LAGTVLARAAASSALAASARSARISPACFARGRLDVLIGADPRGQARAAQVRDALQLGDVDRGLIAARGLQLVNPGHRLPERDEHRGLQLAGLGARARAGAVVRCPIGQR
jgi:hypothetical protein